MTTTRRYAARELDELPEVGDALHRLGLGRLQTSEGAVGRNDNWVGTTTGGERVFVKRIAVDSPDGMRRARRLLRFEAFARDHATIPVPACLGSDLDAGVFVYAAVDHAATGSALMVEERFTLAHAAATGRALAVLHDAALPGDAELDDPIGLLPSSHLLEGLPWSVFEHSSAAQLHAWSLMQEDRELCAAVARLETDSAAARRTPAHCDFRVDQILGHRDGILVCDWEEFRLADPARDTGGFVGEWLYRAVLDVPTRRGDSGDGPVHLDHGQVVGRGEEKLLRLLPVVESFWASYCAGRAVTPAFAARTAAFAGWHLLDRMLAGAMNVARLQPIQRAAAGVGRGVLLAPERAVPALGLAAAESGYAA